MSFLFGGNTGMTYEEMMAKRKLAEGLVGGLNNAPRNVGEGWSAIGAALASRIAGNKANKAETAGRDGASSVFADLFQRQLGGGQGAQGSMAGGLSNTFAAMPRSEGQQVANDAMGAIGKPQSAPSNLRDGIMQTAKGLGIDPVDLATAISYETAGTFDPTKKGPTTQWGQHRGLIQFGEPQAKQYGVDWNDPIGSQLGENGAVAKYLRDTGVKPGMGMMDIYSAINAGGVGRYGASDANNGGAPGTVADKVNSQMQGHRAKAAAMFAGDNSYQQGGGVDPALIEAMGNPYMSEQQRSALGMILQQRIAASAPKDPMQQIEYEKAQLELERMRNPQGIEGKAVGDALVNPITGEVIYQGAAKADPTTSQRDYSFYAQQEAEQGRQPLSFNEWDLQSRKAGATTVNNNLGENPSMIGTIPQGYTAIADPNEPSGYRMVAISGGPEDQSAAAAVAASNQAIASDTITTAALRARDAATSRQLTGPLGAIAAYNPASQNAEVYRQVDVLKSNAKIGNLQSMRDASPTGGALGAVTEKELQMLSDKSGALNPSSPNFLRDLDDYERTMLRIVHGYEAGDQVFAATRKDPPPKPGAANSGAAPTHRFNPATGKIEMIGGN